MKKNNIISNNKNIMSNLNKFLTFLSVLTLTFLAASCVSDDDYNIPNLTVNEPLIPEDKITTFKAIKSRFEQAQANGDPTAIIDSDLYIVGYVVSSDRAGNFFEELIIQNKIDDSNPAEDPRLGFRISVNVGSLSDTYEFGRKVYIKLNGLTVGEANGVLVIAKGKGSDVEQIQAYEYKDFIIRGAEVATITPKTTSISSLSEADENTFIQLDNVQFEKGDLALTYAGESSDEFDGFRTLISCENSNQIELQTSTFADFKSIQIAQNRGSIKGVFSRDFRDNFNVFIINSTSDVNFDNEQRCDPVFEESFNSAIDNTNLNIDGWINYAEAGSELWTEQVYNNNGYAEFSAFRTGESSNIGWLITPPIDMDAQTGEILTFQTEHAYPDAGHDPLDVLISTNFDGTEAGITSATWTSLTFNVSYIEDASTWFTFTDSGEIDLSSYTGTAYIAFRYTGSDTANQNMTLHVENVKVLVR